MWIVTKGAFLSIVSKDCGPDELLVRARRPGDIEKVFPQVKVVEGAGTDYRCRAVIKRQTVAEAIANEVEAVDYGNFKTAVYRAGEYQLETVLHRVWDCFLRLAPGGRMG
jgi:hypothetical protein